MIKAAIVGRANTGKSSLFNRLAGKRIALTFDERGITRDILKERVCRHGHEFEIIDSGGLPLDPKDQLSIEILKKIKEALKEASAFIVVADGRAGPQPDDLHALRMVRKTGKPFLLFVNKADDPAKESLMTADFLSLAEHVISGSCERNFGVSAVEDWLLKLQPRRRRGQEKKEQRPKAQPLPSQKGAAAEAGGEKPESAGKEAFEIFVAGKANSGKSLLCNRLLGRDRMIVSPFAGTTLDSVRERLIIAGEGFVISDNPGSRRGRRKERERLSFAKSQSLFNKTNMALLVIDSAQGPAKEDARFIRRCLEKGKPLIIAGNKWDLIPKGAERAALRKRFQRFFHFANDLPLALVSAKTGEGHGRLLKAVQEMKAKMSKKIPTGRLNEFLSKTLKEAPAPVYQGANVKIYYITQSRGGFLAFANRPKGISPSYKRFILNRIKEKFGLQGVPLRLTARPRRESGADGSMGQRLKEKKALRKRTRGAI